MSFQCAVEPGFGQAVRQMGKMMEQVQKGFCGFCPNETWTPAVNLYENDSAYLVCVDLAGVNKEKIDLTVAETRLKIKGERAAPSPPEQYAKGHSRRMRVHLMEIDNGQFYREVDLPDDVEHENITASYDNGMLWIELPKGRRQ